MKILYLRNFIMYDKRRIIKSNYSILLHSRLDFMALQSL
jgi:hypothetical protein